MTLRLLVVEDDQFKANDLTNHTDGDCEAVVVGSVRDAVVKVVNEDFDAIVLDMALPTFTADAVSASGTAQAQGGVEVLRALKSQQTSTPVIIVSQYPDLEIEGAFYSLEASSGILSARYGINVIGAVVYDFQNSEWSQEFRRLLEDI